jgi:Fe-S cluster assembly ATP-binding protein
LDDLHIDEKFLDRELNVWFSGWEKRKIEILQMKLIGPKYIILDEIDSWLDLDAFRTIATMLKDLSNENNTFIIITHYFKILEYIDVDKVYLIEDWKITREGDKNLSLEISEKGFGK